MRVSLLLALLLPAAHYGFGQDFSAVEIRTTRVTDSIHVLEGSGGNSAVSIGDDPGPAHADGDAIVHFRDSNVLHMGDVFVRHIPESGAMKTPIRSITP